MSFLSQVDHCLLATAAGLRTLGPALSIRSVGVHFPDISLITQLHIQILAQPFNERFITEAAAKYDLPRESLAADKYLID